MAKAKILILFEIDDEVLLDYEHLCYSQLQHVGLSGKGADPIMTWDITNKDVKSRSFAESIMYELDKVMKGEDL